MTSDGSRAIVWDWERFEGGVPVGYDAAHYQTQLAIVRRRSPRWMPRTGSSPPHQVRSVRLSGPTRRPGHRLLYLIEVGTRYTVDGQAEAGARLGNLNAWLLPALRSGIDAWLVPGVMSRRTAAPGGDLSGVARGSTANLLGAVVVALTTLALTLVVTHGMSKSAAGVFFSATSVFVLATSIGQLGTNTGLVYFLSGSARWATVPAASGSSRSRSGRCSSWVFSWRALMIVIAEPLGRLMVPDHAGEAATYIRVLAALVPVVGLENVALSATRGWARCAPMSWWSSWSARCSSWLWSPSRSTSQIRSSSPWAGACAASQPRPTRTGTGAICGHGAAGSSSRSRRGSSGPSPARGPWPASARSPCSGSTSSSSLRWPAPLPPRSTRRRPGFSSPARWRTAPCRGGATAPRRPWPETISPERTGSTASQPDG